jgi:hypothetical protein
MDEVPEQLNAIDNPRAWAGEVGICVDRINSVLLDGG